MPLQHKNVTIPPQHISTAQIFQCINLMSLSKFFFKKQNTINQIQPSNSIARSEFILNLWIHLLTICPLGRYVHCSCCILSYVGFPSLNFDDCILILMTNMWSVLYIFYKLIIGLMYNLISWRNQKSHLAFMLANIKCICRN